MPAIDRAIASPNTVKNRFSFQLQISAIFRLKKEVFPENPERFNLGYPDRLSDSDCKRAR